MNEKKLTLLEWCDKQDAEDKELSIGWEGGGDNGFAFFKLDGESIDNEYTEILLDHIYNELDYGSWAGEFSASGEAVYSSTTKCFEGIDYCSNDNYIQYDCKIKIKIPKEFSFEEIVFESEDINNGIGVFVKTELEECSSYLKDIKTDINNQCKEVIKNFENDGYTYIDTYFEEVIFKDDCSLEGDFLIFEINSISMRTEETDERNILLNVSEIH